MAKTQKLPFARGEDVLIVASFTPGADSDVTSIAGWSIKFALSTAAGVTPLITKTVGAGITITDPVARTIEISLAFADTNALAPATYYFDIWRTDTGEHGRLAKGTAVVEQRVASIS